MEELKKIIVTETVLLQAASRYDEAFAKIEPSKSKDIYGNYPEVKEALQHLYECIEEGATVDNIRSLVGGKGESHDIAVSAQTGLELAKGICDHPELTKGRFLFASELLRDAPLKNYDPWKAISLCEGKKSERQFVQFQDNKSLYLNRASCTVLLAKTEKFSTDKVANINLDTYDEVTTATLPAGTYVNGLEVLRKQEAGIPVYPYKNVVNRPYLLAADFEPLDTKKIKAVFDRLGYPHKEKLPKRNDLRDEPSVLLLFRGRFATCVQWGVLCQFLDAAAYINADVIAYSGANMQIMAFSTKSRDAVLGMPLACYDAVGWLTDQNSIVIEMQEDWI